MGSARAPPFFGGGDEAAHAGVGERLAGVAGVTDEPFAIALDDRQVLVHRQVPARERCHEFERSVDGLVGRVLALRFELRTHEFAGLYLIERDVHRPAQVDHRAASVLAHDGDDRVHDADLDGPERRGRRGWVELRSDVVLDLGAHDTGQVVEATAHDAVDESLDGLAR